MRTFISVTVLLFLVSISCRDNPDEKSGIKVISAENIGWRYSDSLRITIHRPSIPERIFTIPSNGASDGIQKAIDKAAAEGGGTVSIQKGTHLSNPVNLKSNVHIYLEDGAVLKFIPFPEKYPLVYTWFEGIPCMNYSSMIYACDQVNIKISGKGIIDGQGNLPVWKNMKYREEVDWSLLKDMEDEDIDPEHRNFGTGHSLRPDLIAFVNCRQTEISGITLLNSPYWSIHPILCEDMYISKLKINSSGYNQAGIVPESSCRILIEDVSIQGTNDGIRIRSGRVKFPSLRSSQNIMIQNVSLQNIVDDAIAIGTKVRGGADRIFISDITINGAKRGFTIIPDAELKGTISEIFIKGVVAKNIWGPVILCRISHGTSDYLKSILYDLHFENFSVDSCGRAFEVVGSKRQLIQNISISNSSFLAFKGSLAEHVMNLNLKNLADQHNIYNIITDIEGIETDELEFTEKDDDILDSDDIPFDNLNEKVKKAINTLCPLTPIEDIKRIITKTGVNYEIEFNPENSYNLALLISSDGEVIRSEEEIPFRKIPAQVRETLQASIKTELLPFLVDDIKKITVRDFNYYEIKGETRNNLFLSGIAEDGSILEEKQKQITWMFPDLLNKVKK